jgi:hypothetical protein
MQFRDRLTEEAFGEVAALLAAAYLRYIAIGLVPVDLPEAPPRNDLDNPSPSSLHGGS